MLDKRSLALLEYLDKECLDGGYKVFSLTELVSAMPTVFSADAEAVKECVKALAEREYISVKYFGEEEVCLLPLLKGRLVFENRLDEEIEKTRSEKKYFLSALAGGAAGAFAAGILALIVLWISGAV